MDLSIKLKYLFIYTSLNVIGLYIAFLNWWPGDFFLIFSFGLCWIGIFNLSIMLNLLLSDEVNKKKFVSFFSLVTIEDYEYVFGKDKGEESRTKIIFFSLVIMILTFFIFRFTMDTYEKNQLKKYGVIEKIKIFKKMIDLKGNETCLFLYNNQNRLSSLITKPSNKKISAEKNDSITVIYSSKNPKIIDLYSNYLKEK